MNEREHARRIRFYEETTNKLSLLTVYNNTYLDKFFPFKIKTKEAIFKLWFDFLKYSKDQFLSLYVHIPFCKNSKCSYCMYSSHVLINSVEMDAYLDYLQDEIQFFSPVFSNSLFTTLYIGGGTPSVMNVRQIKRLSDMIFNNFKFKPGGVGSKSMEFSSSTVTTAKISAAKDCGIDRISMGIQALDRDVLRFSNREYVPFSQLKKIIQFIKMKNFRDFNIDLMAWLPGDTIDKFMDVFKKMIQLGIPSITVYFYRYEFHKFKKLSSLKCVSPYFNYRYPYDRKELLDTIKSFLKEHSYDYSSNIGYNREFQRFTKAGIELPVESKTEPSWFLQNSMLGLGFYSRSFIRNVFEYFNVNDRIGDLNFTDKRYTFKEYSLDHQMRQFVLREFENYNRISLPLFKRIFKKDFCAVFKNEVGSLLGLNKIEIKDGQVIFLTDSLHEFSIYSKFFYDQEILKKAASNLGINA